MTQCASICLAALLTGLFLASVDAQQTAPLHLLFWQEADVEQADGVSFMAHPFPEDRVQVLLLADPDRPSLWYVPTGVAPAAEGLRIYYQRAEREQPEYVHQRTLCMAILGDDGLSLPDIKQHEHPWGGPANVVLQRSPHTPTWGGFNVFQMAGSAAEGFRLLYWDQPAEGSAGAMLATSPDGIRWQKDEARAVFTEHNDAFTLIRSRHADEFLLYQTHLKPWPEKPHPDNLDGRRRVTSLRRSSDLIQWSPQEIILEPDERDGEAAEFYLLKVFYCVDRYVGLLMKYYANPQMPNRHSDLVTNELIFSRDGLAWQRPYREVDPGLWTYADPFEYKGSLCVVAHKNRNLVLARTRLDGLASVGATGRASFRTHPFVMPRADLRMNADCTGGWVAVELLDDNGTVLDTCRVEGIDGVAAPLDWEGDGASAAVGKSVQLRLTMEHARVYSLRSAEPGDVSGRNGTADGEDPWYAAIQ